LGSGVRVSMWDAGLRREVNDEEFALRDQRFEVSNTK
jgi:hypothetical protein